MFSTDAMEYGTFPMDFPLREDFLWVYPTRCGYDAAKSNGAISSEPGGLLVYIVQGQGTAEHGGETCNYCTDCVIAVPDAAKLKLYPLAETQYLYLLLKNAEQLLAGISKNGFVQPVAADSRIDRLLGRICYNAKTKQLNNIYSASADAFTLLMETCAQCETERVQYSALVQEAIETIRQEYAFLTGVDELADRLGVTKNHLIRSFTGATGHSPGKYLQTVKLDNAKLMLQNRDYSIEMVADMVGYSGANYFCKVFRRATGESPGAYRARQLAHTVLDPENKRRIEALEGIYHV